MIGLSRRPAASAGGAGDEARAPPPARTLAITDATLSEVAKLAQSRLYYSSNRPAYVRSHTALLSLIQALAYGVYARDADAVRRPHQGLQAQVASPRASASETGRTKSVRAGASESGRTYPA